jgi:hypothetical protein
MHQSLNKRKIITNEERLQGRLEGHHGWDEGPYQNCVVAGKLKTMYVV